MRIRRGVSVTKNHKKMKKLFSLFLMAVCLTFFLACDKDGPSNEPIDPSLNPSDESRDPNLPEGYPVVAGTENALTLVFRVNNVTDKSLVLCGNYFKAVATKGSEYNAEFAALDPQQMTSLGNGWYSIVVYPAFAYDKSVAATMIKVGDITYKGVTALPAVKEGDALIYTKIDKSTVKVYPAGYKNDFLSDLNGNMSAYFTNSSDKLSSALGKVVYYDALELGTNGRATFSATIDGLVDGYEPYFSSVELADYPIASQKMALAEDGNYKWTGDFVTSENGTFVWTVVLQNAEGSIIRTEDTGTLSLNPVSGLSGTFTFFLR